MVEHRRFGNLLPHLVLLAGVAIVAFPVYLAVIASTHDNTVIANGQMPLYPGSHGLETYWNTIVSGTGRTTRAPVGGMMLNSLIMALGITVGKIAISIISAYAIVFFSFPFRMTAFWTIFITLMLPVEVRIFPTYKITSDLHMLDSYSGLILPLIASATATLLFRQFFMTVPKELVEASKIDGAGPIRFFWDTLLPLSVTNIAALFVILFIYGWNHDPRRHADHRDRHQEDHRRARCPDRMAGGDGDRRACHAASGRGRRADATPVRQGPDRDGKMRWPT
jgi:sn-glycerol 3-phosphate transport system permease protein